MSGKATGWVYEKSPYKGAAFQVHLAIADVVNDMHGWEFWAANAALATKARIGRQACNEAIQRMVDDGFLKVLYRPPQGSKASVRYRFLFPDVPVVWAGFTPPEHVAQGDMTTRTAQTAPEPHVARDDKLMSPGTTPHVATGDTELKGTQGGTETKGASSSADAADDAAGPPALPDLKLSPEVERVVEYLLAAVTAHSGKVPVTDAWARPIDLLLRRGPTGFTPEPIPVERVLRAIDWIFTTGAEVSSSGFSWADQIQSGSSLRKYWHKMYLAAKSQKKAASGPRRLTAAQERNRSNAADTEAVVVAFARATGQTYEGAAPPAPDPFLPTRTHNEETTMTVREIAR